jgi:AraC-like DNA-binding protein
MLPRPELARHVACLWVQVVGEQAIEQPVVPDACADIISIAGAAPVVVGPATRTERVVLPARTVIVGARLRPGSVGIALGLPAAELVDRDVALAAIWRPASGELADRLASGTVRDKLAALERALVDTVAPRVNDRLARAAVAWIARHPDAHVATLARELGISSRQLQRRMLAASGYAPKLLHRILRFQRLIVEMSRVAGAHASLAMLAAAAGYLDQAHMTREVRELAGVTPRVLLARRTAPVAMSEFFKTVDAEQRIVGG